jgi:hypothetical protein
MAEISYFFESSGTGVNYYNTNQIADWMYQALGRPSGVLSGLDNALAPTTTGALNSTYNTGVATLAGRIYKNTTSLALTHTAPTSGYKRIDLVVVRFDDTTNLSANLTIIPGTQSNTGGQTAPSPLATDISIAQVLIDGTNSNLTTVTDVRTLLYGSALAPQHDTNGDYYLGKLWHLPLGNTTNRFINFSFLPSVGTWTAAQQVTGLYGVPSGAKAVRAKVTLQAYATGTPGPCSTSVCFSDNNSNNPGQTSAHPEVTAAGYQSNAAMIITNEIDIPLNSLGQFYMYILASATPVDDQCRITMVGYYMGD